MLVNIGHYGKPYTSCPLNKQNASYHIKVTSLRVNLEGCDFVLLYNLSLVSFYCFIKIVVLGGFAPPPFLLLCSNARIVTAPANNVIGSIQKNM